MFESEWAWLVSVFLLDYDLAVVLEAVQLEQVDPTEMLAVHGPCTERADYFQYLLGGQSHHLVHFPAVLGA